jgi:hypothetical protein
MVLAYFGVDSVWFLVYKKHLNKWAINTPEGHIMTETQKNVETIKKCSTGLDFKSFVHVMITAGMIKKAYSEIYPDVEKQTYEQMWVNILHLSKRLKKAQKDRETIRRGESAKARFER